MKITPTGFQAAAAKAAVNAFNQGRSRYLIADETGLGKTIVARTVIDLLSAQAACKPFKIYYFGTNLMLLDDTVEKLTKGKSWTTPNEPSKLGMMIMRPLPKTADVLIYSFSANLLGESGIKSGDDENERPYYAGLPKDSAHYLPIKMDKTTEALLKEQDLTQKNIAPIREFAEKYTLYCEPPGLVIFDEFHRYDNKLTYFLGVLGKIKEEHPEYKEPPILLLSATPYNYYPDLNKNYSSAAEDEETGTTNYIRDFSKLLELLAPDMCQEYADFKDGKITPNKFSEKLIKNCIYRNERIYDGDLKYKTLPTAKEFKEVFAHCINEERFVSKQSDVPKYYKLCSGVYSFPIKVYKKKEDPFYSDLEKPEKFNSISDELFVFGTDHKLKRGAPFFDNLRFACIEHYNAKEGRKLLWVPPSKPEYSLEGPFDKNDFTKLMVFSAYKMVPRIVSGVFSAYASDDVDTANAPTIDLADIDKRMQPLVSDKLDISNEIYARLVSGDTAKTAKTVTEELANKLNKILPEGDELSLLAKYIIGSPYMCALRAFKDEEAAREIAKCFNIYFKKEGIRQAVLNKDNGIGTDEELLDYCIAGGLGAVMEEYAFSGGSAKDMMTALCYGSEKSTVVHVFSSDRYTVTNCEPFQIKCHYAERFNADYTDNGKAETNRDGQEHFRSCHKAFNSPFWPMILCTTSKNQEGYDLDRYCSRIMHYSLPPNTMSFEQRDGRIDRRLSLLARRRMVQLYGTDLSWSSLFSRNMDACGMSPCWTQKDYFSICEERDLPPLKFERIVPYFPMTDEYILYTRLRDHKNLYRRHFGLPTEAVSGETSKDLEPLKLNEIQ